MTPFLPVGRRSYRACTDLHDSECLGADSRPTDERARIRRLAGLSSETEIARTPAHPTIHEPRIFEPETSEIETYIQSLETIKQWSMLKAHATLSCRLGQPCGRRKLACGLAGHRVFA